MDSTLNNKNKKFKQYAIFGVSVVAIIIILLLIRSCRDRSYQNKMLAIYRKKAYSILRPAWEHYKKHENFEGDWWSSKFPHPKMIMNDGRPIAFMDGSDQDLDGIRDINWSDPKKPYELLVVSESASYALLRAIIMKDKETFDKVWKWTKQHLQHSQIDWVYYWKDVKHPDNKWQKVSDLNIEKDNLFAWRWTPSIADRDGDGKSDDGIIFYRWQQPSDTHNPNDPWRDGWDAATDADEDIALSLIFADALWKSTTADNYLNYANEAKKILDDIWKKETYIHLEHRYLAGGDNIKGIETGYLSPFSYRIFDDFDPEHNWMDLVDSSYRVFNLSSIAVLSDWIDRTGEVHNQNPYKRKIGPRANLLPDWVNLDREGNIIDGVEREEPEFGTDAFRGLWRIAVDYDWSKDKRATEYLKHHSPYGPYDFLDNKIHDKKGDWDKTKNYDESERLSSVYWHDGGYTLYESNYEPDADEPNRLENAYDSRANAAQYAVYLSYYWGSYLFKPSYKTFDMIEKTVLPIITDEMDGFSKREYVIPEDQLKNESKANLAKNTPLNQINPKDDIGTPYDSKDGWLATDSDGYYWTIFDHSEWNSQMDYFSNTWTWLGLAFFAGIVKNNYNYQNIEPDVTDFYVFLDKNYQYKAIDEINAEDYYIEANGKDKNPKHRDYFYMKVQTTQKNSKPITVKMVETGKNTGVFRSKGYIGLESSDAADRVAGSVGKYIDFIVIKDQKLRKRYRIGKMILTTVIEDFENGSIFDANPLAWWTDSLKPGSGKPKMEIGKSSGVYIWRDSEWHIRFLADDKDHIFNGSILTDGLMETANVLGLEKEDHFQKLKKSVNFTFTGKSDFDGIDFNVRGRYIIFDIKYDGYYQLGAFNIGANNDTAHGMPFVLRNYGETGTYQLGVNKDKAINSKYSLQIDKKYIGKEYPYMGSVIFADEHKDWSQYDEFTFDVYLEKDIGPIRVDIQDEDGTVVILNGYNPWSSQKGPGWYKWRSNSPMGVDVNARLLQPFSIRYRNWWKGWDFDAGRNVDKTKDINLTKIRNVMFCIHGGHHDSSQLLVDNLTLERVNYYYGYHEPKSIKKINLYKDANHTKLLSEKEKLTQENIYVEVIGKDASPDTFDKFSMKVETTDKYPGCHNIEFELLETAENSGIYNGEFRVGVKSDYSHKVIGAANGHWIKIFSDVKKSFSKNIQVGNFKITNILDSFDDIAAGNLPESWWIDTVDPTSGMPIYPAGNKLGYFIWKDGKTWKIRWSSDQKDHSFKGEIYTNKSFRISNEYSLEKDQGDIVTQVSKKHIKFNATEKFAEDGFDFKIDGDFVEFYLLIDGKKYADRTWVGPYDWNKAYAIPFTINEIGKTRSYDLVISNRQAVSKPNSMLVKKTYFSKDYPYIGKWGLSGDLQDWDNKDELVMWVYLREDVGNIRVDIEDHNRQTAVLHEYNPYSYEKGPGWYRWSSSYPSGLALAIKAIDLRNIKDRRFWMSYDTLTEQYVDVTSRFRLDNILNFEVSIGGGEKRDATVNLDDIYLIRNNRHIGYTNPTKINSIKIYKADNYLSEMKTTITQQDVFVELQGLDGDPNTQDKINLEINTDDKLVDQKKITIFLYETGSNTGVYRGNFKVDLRSNENEDTIGASWHSIVSLFSPVDVNYIKKYPVELLRLTYVIDDFEDGSVLDKYPVTWWISGTRKEDQSYTLTVEELQNKRVMKIDKTYVGDDYPYFGAWGLQDEKQNWLNKEDLIMDMYLKSNPGNIRVDIEDQAGVVAVLNGYSPWDDEKGAGWYQWKASDGVGREVNSGLVDLDKIKYRKWWKGWDKDLGQYTDVSKTINLEKIINLQVQIDGEGSVTKELKIDTIYLVNHNYYEGNSAPKVIDRFNFYYDPEHIALIPKDGEIIFKDQYLEVVGIDEDPLRRDRFPANLLIWDGAEKYAQTVYFTETDINSGVYRNHTDLLKLHDPVTALTPTPGNQVSIYITKKDQSRKVTIKSLYAFDWNLLDKYLKSLGYSGKRFGIWWWLILLLIISICAGGGYYYYKQRKQKELPSKLKK
ncbi:MAG: hypothetical protein A2Y40_07410 [Candidatus Margulisbacteria bacterium GWF2_35_9]|nr:MAG: hypothetical protein A2Y40_07410 [Candidatus Margulisbacteria bacterium GWF2_35_9]